MGCNTKYQAPPEDVDYNIKDLPAEKVLAMQQYAVKLRKKFPHMKPERVAKKVAQEFNITLQPAGALKPPASSVTPAYIKR